MIQGDDISKPLAVPVTSGPAGDVEEWLAIRKECRGSLDICANT